MERYLNFLVRHPKKLVLLMLLTTAGFVMQFKHLTMIHVTAAFLPQGHPFVIVKNRVEQIFGNDNKFVIGITPKNGDAFQIGVLTKVKSITDQIYNLPGVISHSVSSIAARKTKNISGADGNLNVKPIMEELPRNAEEIEKVRTTLRNNPIYTSLIVSKDEHTLLISADFKKDKAGYQVMAKRIYDIVDAERDATVDIDVSGKPTISALIEKYGKRMGPLFLLSVLIIGLIHYEAFRTLQALILPLVTGVLAVVWALGTMAMLGLNLDALNALTPILILAIAAGHAVQILKRFYEEFNEIRKEQPQLPLKEANRLAVVRSIKKVGPVMIAAGCIAAVSFFSLLIFEIAVVWAFGVFAGLGVVYAMILELMFIPAIRAILPAPSERESRREAQVTIWDKAISKAAHLALFERKKIYTACLIASAVLLFGAITVKIDGSSKGYFYGKLPELVADKKLNEIAGGTNVLYGLVEGKDADALKNPETLKAMDKIQRFVEQDPLVGKTISIADFIKRLNFAMHDNDPAFSVVPDSQDLIGQYLLLYSSSGAPDDFDNWVDYSYKTATITAFVNTDGYALIDELTAKINKFAQGMFPPGVSFNLGGQAAEGSAVVEVIVREKLLNIAQIALAVFLISSLLFRSIIAGTLILAPLVMTVLANFGIMGWLGIPLQIGTAVTSAMAVGIGADYAIYLTYRFREELRKGGKEVDAILRAFASAGKAIFFVSTAVAGGYSVLMLSYGFLVHVWLGFLISIAMVASAISALTVFPALVLTLRPKFIFGDAPKPTSETKSNSNGATPQRMSA